MENSLTTILSTLVGAAIALLASYIVEFRRSENEKHKFSLEKIISVGEKFYELSGFSLLVFETRLDGFEKASKFSSQEAMEIYMDTENSMQEQVKNIQKTTNTITSADIYFKVSGVEYARKWAASYQQALANFLEATASDDPDKNAQAENTIAEIKNLLKEIIATIIQDRQTVSTKIQKLVLLNKE